MLNSLDFPTDATTSFTSSCDLSGWAETDVVWFDGNLQSGVRGQAVCEDFDGNYCDQYYVTLDPAQLNIGGNDDADTTKTACHELGHTVGLTHGDGGGSGGNDD